MKRRIAPKSNKKYVIIGLLLALFLSLYYLSLQKKKEGMKNKKKEGMKNKKKEGMKTKKKNDDDNLSTEQILRQKLAMFKKKIEKMSNDKRALKGENVNLKNDIEMFESKLNNKESIEKIKIGN